MLTSHLVLNYEYQSISDRMTEGRYYSKYYLTTLLPIPELIIVSLKYSGEKMRGQVVTLEEPQWHEGNLQAEMKMSKGGLWAII